ncbi:MAG: deoxyribonuclease IV [Dehalococcoidia bacterium]
MKVGAHVSAAAPLAKCVDRACDIGAEAIQIFASGPQSWRPGAHTEEAMAALKSHAEECGIDTVFLHGVYLVNLATADETLLNRSVGSLKQYLKFCGATGARGTIFHVGSHKGSGFDGVLPQIAASIGRVLEATPPETWLILENSAGQGGTVGGRFAELAAIIDAVGSERVKVCLDTCHLYAAGYDIATPAGCDATMEEFGQTVGLDRLVAVHANDSKAGLGSGLDRHENIGEGQIGREGFRVITGHPAFQPLPFILEVPGYEGKGPDRRNVETLRAICVESGALAG